MVEQTILRERRHTVPVSLALQLLELVKRWRVPPEELLSVVGLTETALQNPLDRLPVETMCELLERARVLTGEPGLGYYLGLQKRVSVYGYLGFAAVSASSLREALELAVRFGPLFSTAISLNLHVEGGAASLCFEEQVDLGPARDIVLISLLFGLQTIGTALTGQEAGGSADLAIPQPDYQARFANLAHDLRFGQPFNRLVVDAKTLDFPIVTADRMALQMARTLCERSLDDLGFDTGLVDRVRRLVANDQNGFRSLEQVATCMHLSPRTLKRRLAAQGVSFSALVDRERREKAMVLLRSSRLSIDDVAERLDYSTASTFVRAFHRWTGTTPGAYRRAGRHRFASDAGRQGAQAQVRMKTPTAGASAKR
jgi:AraC-like DNA-binding protein